MEETFKSLAKDAKKRLKLSNYFQKSLSTTNYSNNIQAQSYIKNENKKMITQNSIDSEEQLLWQKVCSIMESDQDIINPISLLIDKNKYSSMDDIARQVYVLKLSTKYAELKQRYIKEHKILA